MIGVPPSSKIVGGVAQGREEAITDYCTERRGTATFQFTVALGYPQLQSTLSYALINPRLLPLNDAV